MKFLARLVRGAPAVLLLCVSLNGCTPSGQSQLEEEKEPHFLEGKRCFSSMDYKGAIEKFEQALEVNPHSASAHFQLGCLYEEKEPDPAAAIYHYERFLKLRPDADNAEVIRQHITNCKQDLAKTVLPLPITPGMTHEFEQLVEENKRLRSELERWQAHFANLPPSPTNGPDSNVAARPQPSAPVRTAAINPITATGSTPGTRSGVVVPRNHIVQAGDTPYSIARKYDVKLELLMAANPGVDARRLRPGQTLNLPTP